MNSQGRINHLPGTTSWLNKIWNRHKYRAKLSDGYFQQLLALLSWDPDRSCRAVVLCTLRNLTGDQRWPAAQADRHLYVNVTWPGCVQKGHTSLQTSAESHQPRSEKADFLESRAAWTVICMWDDQQSSLKSLLLSSKFGLGPWESTCLAHCSTDYTLSSKGLFR